MERERNQKRKIDLQISKHPLLSLVHRVVLLARLLLSRCLLLKLHLSFLVVRSLIRDDGPDTCFELDRRISKAVSSDVKGRATDMLDHHK